MELRCLSILSELPMFFKTHLEMQLAELVFISRSPGPLPAARLFRGIRHFDLLCPLSQILATVPDFFWYIFSFFLSFSFPHTLEAINDARLLQPPAYRRVPFARHIRSR